MPVYRLTASSIISSFRVSGKRHLLLTGGRGTGKTTLLRALVPLLCPGAQCGNSRKCGRKNSGDRPL